MPPRKQPWFRFYVEAIWDRKLRRLPVSSRWLWVTVLACAKSSPVPGELLLTEGDPMTAADLADAAALPEGAVVKGLDALLDLCLIHMDTNSGGYAVTRWNERQFESDTSSQRTAKHRSNERPKNGGVTPPENREQKQISDAEKTLAPKTARKPDLLFDAVTQVCGMDPEQLTDSSRGALNKSLAMLRGVGADPAEVPVRAANWQTVFPEATLTPTALAKHWPQLEKARTPNGRRDRFVEMGQSLNERMGGGDEQASGLGNQARRSLPQG